MTGSRISSAYHWTTLFTCLALLIGMVSFSGCAREETPPTTVPTPAPSPTPTPTPTPAPAPAPVGPQRVVIAQATDVRSWDPPQDWISAADWITMNAYDFLNLLSADGGEWIPALAKSWEIRDELTHRFFLEEGVKFHDGTELTAEDVRFHYHRIIDAPTREIYIVRDQYQWIDRLEVIDDYTIDVISHEPWSLFMWQLTQQNTGAGIVSKAYFEEVGVEGVHRWPMGTGPFKLQEHVRDEFVLMIRNDDYWQKDRMPNYEELEYRIIPEASTRVAELLTGGVDFIYDVVPQDKDRIDANPDVRTMWVDTARGHMLSVRTGARAADNYPNPDYAGDPELDRRFATEDPRVREAIELAIDKYALREITGGTGQAFRARGPFMPLPEAQSALFGPDASLYDPEKARAILADAGYAPGEPTLVFHASEAWPHGDMARVIEDMLEHVGFTVDLRLLDASTWRSEVYLPGKNQELNLMSLGPNMNPYFATISFHTMTLGRPTTISPNPAIDPDWVWQTTKINELLDYAWTEVVDEQARINAYHEATMLAAERRGAIIGLLQMSTLYALSNRIEHQPRFDIELWGYDFRVVE